MDDYDNRFAPGYGTEFTPNSAQALQASRRNAAPAQQTGDLKRQLEQTALAVDKLSQALALIEKKLADPALYNENPDTIAGWQRKHADVAKRLSDAEDAWLKAQASFDQAGT